MDFFRNIFGLESNRPGKNGCSLIQGSTVTNLSDIGHRKIYPVLMSEHTSEFDLTDEVVDIFHRREGIFSKQLIAHVLLDEKETIDGEPTIYQLNTSDKTREDYSMLQEEGRVNLDKFKLPFENWIVDNKLTFKILSCPISSFSSEKILSKKHMDEAHKELNSEELLVSIPRRGLIFVCSNSLSEEDCNHFINLHARIVCQESDQLELLCEDIFVVKDGEVSGVLGMNPLSDILREKVA